MLRARNLHRIYSRSISQPQLPFSPRHLPSIDSDRLMGERWRKNRLPNVRSCKGKDRISSLPLEGPSNCKFEFVELLMDAERNTRRWPNEIAVKAIRIYRVDHPKGHIDHGQQNLKLHSGAGPDA